MYCRRCGKAVPDDAKACPQCGVALAGASTVEMARLPWAGDASAFPIGKRLMNDRYEIVREVGRGAWGVVYQATDRVRKRDVALKTLPSRLRDDQRAIAYLLREVNLTLERLNHDHICRIYEFQQCPEAQFILMEYVNGESLDKLLARNLNESEQGFPLKQVLEWLEPICAALDYAHRKGVVHRDLKPANVLVRSTDRVVKLTDFGLARAIGESTSTDSAQTVKGTPLYAPPEQWDCRSDVDGRADIYSLGMMTCELLTGNAPFAGALDFAHCHKNVDIEDIPGQPAHVNAALKAATAKSRDDRPKTAGEFLARLRAAEQMLRPAENTGDRPKTTADLRPRIQAAPAAQRLVKPPVVITVPDTGTKPGEARTFAGIEMVWIPRGEFVMGSPLTEEGRQSDETQHRVTLTKGFWMGKYQVTQAQWNAVMGSNPSLFEGDSLPVERVSWEDCQAFIRQLNANAKDQGTFRLPTEAEWEYACRAGTTTPFSFGATISTDQANYDGDYTYGAGRKGVYRRKTVAVGSFPPNAWGLHDMHGNVWEWCQDWYGDYAIGAMTDPIGGASGQDRVVRGGSWYYTPSLCRAAYRFHLTPDSRLTFIGFRLSRTP